MEDELGGMSHSPCGVSEAIASVVQVFHKGDWRTNPAKTRNVMMGLVMFMQNIPPVMLQDKEVDFLAAFCTEVGVLLGVDLSGQGEQQ